MNLFSITWPRAALAELSSGAVPLTSTLVSTDPTSRVKSSTVCWPVRSTTFGRINVLKLVSATFMV